MKRFQGVFLKIYVLLILGVLAWSVLTYAQGTNVTATTTATTDGSIKAVTTVVQEEGPVLTFGLDRIEEMRRSIFGIPPDTPPPVS